MKEKFLERFINEEMYLQNPPLETKSFIKFCEERGFNIKKEQLEMYEKEKLLFPIMRIKRDIELNPGGRDYYTNISFGDEFYPNEKNHLINLLNKGSIYDPSRYKLENWSSFKGELNHTLSDKTLNMYSSFQLFQIEEIEKYLIKKDSCEKLGIDYHKLQHEDFWKILEFFISLQSIYYPYAKSDSENIIISNNYGRWRDKKLKFNPKIELSKIAANIEDIAYYYHLFSRRSIDILGMKGYSGWIQLMKNISFKKKEKINGKNRLGIEYLQWAIMIKRYLEDYCNRDVLDIDEVYRMDWKNVLNINPSDINIKSSRVDCIDNNNKYHQSSSYRRKFFLANSFRLSYHPSVLVFVEGYTEEMVIPKLYEWYMGIPFEKSGIDIVNVKGVGNFASTYKNSLKLKNLIINLRNRLNKKIKGKNKFIYEEDIRSLKGIIKELENARILTNNFASLISHNLENWQTIPYFISDNEGDVKNFLEDGKPLQFENEYYGVPEDWKYIWGISNNHSPFNGSCFEFSNFTDDEICKSINTVLNKNVSVEEVSDARIDDMGINIIGSEIQQNKLEINKSLFKELCKEFSNTNDENLFKRPIFDVLINLRNLGSLNPMPVNFEIEKINKSNIKDILEGKRNFFEED